MKTLGRLIGELVGWRWAPAVGLCVASLFYVLVVVALVPEEIGVPTTNARLASKVAPQQSEPELPTFPTVVPDSEVAPPAPAPVRPAAVVDFGRRGFSPPIDRPEAPPPPVPPPPPVAPPQPAIAAVQGLAPGSAAAAEAAAIAAEDAANARAAAAAPPPQQPQQPQASTHPLMRTMQAMRGGAFPVPGSNPSAQPAPPGAPPAAPGAPPAAPGAPPAAPGAPPAGAPDAGAR
jgi:hypothetical protein